ncbi:MAG TPA: hypothetical protein VF604_15505 [Pyrinomonadaceae bacterium]
MKNHYRASFIVVLCLTIFMAVGITVTIVSQSPNKNVQNMKNLTTRNDLQNYGVEIIPSSSENFDYELKQYTGSKDSLISLVESARPFAFFIKNNSPKEIVGVSLRWKFTDSNGRSVEIPQSEANPGVLMGIKPLDPRMAGKTSLINSGAIKFFTYFNDLIGHKIAFANMRFKNPSIDYKYQIDSGNTESDISNLNSQKVEYFSRYTDFSMSIDGIVFNDGTFVGADENFFFDTLNGDIQARKDILTALSEARSAGKKDANILEDILAKTSNISANLEALRSGNATREQVFDFSYKNYLKNLRNELVMKRARMSDDYIISQLQIARLSDFVTLHKADEFLK